jgi:hypothetical protein
MAIVVAARAALLERAISKRTISPESITAGAISTWSITTRPVAETTRTWATIAAAWAETVVGAKTAARVGSPAAAAKVATAAAAAAAKSTAGALTAAVPATAALITTAALDTVAAVGRACTVRAVATWAKATRCAALPFTVTSTRRAVLLLAPGAVFVGLGQGRAIGAARTHRSAVRVATCRRAGVFLQGDGGHDGDVPALAGQWARSSDHAGVSPRAGLIGMSARGRRRTGHRGSSAAAHAAQIEPV